MFPLIRIPAGGVDWQPKHLKRPTTGSAGRFAVAQSSRPRDLLEALFAMAFKGLVYPQIWEDPEVDLEALAITPDCDVVAIASGGCNVLSYLIADPKSITAVDLNRAHVALNLLKLCAARRVPNWDAFYRFFGSADDVTNLDTYWHFLAPHLDPDTRSYWERRSGFGLGRQRLTMFTRNIYRYGLLGQFIGISHAIARLYGVEPSDLLRATSLDEQRRFFHSTLAPIFDKRFVRWATARQVSLYGLGIPPAQFEALAPAGSMASVLRCRVERLTCAFSVQENYFAWQALGAGMPGRGVDRCLLICGPNILEQSERGLAAWKYSMIHSPNTWKRVQPVRSIGSFYSMHRTG